MNWKIIFIILVLCCKQTSAQYSHLVFEGAGIRGIAYVGVVEALEKNNIMKEVKVVAGSSAGAITATFLALGYTSQEMFRDLYQVDFGKFNDNKFPIWSGIKNFRNEFGWYQGDKFLLWIEHYIEQKTGNAHCTFKQLQEMPHHMELHIITTALNEQRSMDLNYKTFPNMEIALAVRLSMSIPFYYKALWIDENGKPIDRKNRVQRKYLMLDGGLASNLPIEFFTEHFEHLLAFEIVNKNEFGKYDVDKIAKQEIKGNKDFGKAMYNFMMEDKQRWKKKALGNFHNILISDGGLGPKVRSLTKNEIDILVNNGKSATKNFLALK